MRHLVISDIHANLEALQAVLSDAEGLFDEIVCLGDLVGYGADPNAVVDWVRGHVNGVIRGNHDKACCGLEDPVTFNPIARYAAEWTMTRLNEENRSYLRALDQGPKELPNFVMVHGSIRDEDEYVIDARDALDSLPAVVGRLVFFGHTHIQGGFFLSELGQTTAAPNGATESRSLRIVEGETYLVNPGSVGQPRDLVWQAGYAIFDSDQKTVEFRRCAYDLATAQKKIREAGLPTALADRLALGR